MRICGIRRKVEKVKLFDCEMKAMFCAGWVWCIIKGIGAFLIQMIFKISEFHNLKKM